MRRAWRRALLLAFVTVVTTAFAWGAGAVGFDAGVGGTPHPIDPAQDAAPTPPPTVARRLQIADLPPFEPRAAAAPTESPRQPDPTPAANGDGDAAAAAAAAETDAEPANAAADLAAIDRAASADEVGENQPVDVNPFAPITGGLPALPSEGVVSIGRATAPVIAPRLPGRGDATPPAIAAGSWPAATLLPPPTGRVGGEGAAPQASPPPSTPMEAARALPPAIGVTPPAGSGTAPLPAAPFTVDGVMVGPMPATSSTRDVTPIVGDGGQVVRRPPTAPLAFPDLRRPSGGLSVSPIDRRAEPLATADTTPATATSDDPPRERTVPTPRLPDARTVVPAAPTPRARGFDPAPIGRRGGAASTVGDTAAAPRPPAERATAPRPAAALPASPAPTVDAVVASAPSPQAEPIARRGVTEDANPPLPAGATDLDRFLRDRGYVFTGAVLGPVGVAVFRSGDQGAAVVVALGQTLPDSRVVLTDLRSTQAELTLDDARQVLHLDLRR